MRLLGLRRWVKGVDNRLHLTAGYGGVVDVKEEGKGKEKRQCVRLCSGSAQACSRSAQAKAASCSCPETKTEPARMRLESDFPGSLRRHFFIFASNAVSQRRRSAQALQYSPSPHPLLRLLGHVPISLTTRLCRAKRCQLYATLSIQVDQVGS
jgi:hypothetical protein